MLVREYCTTSSTAIEKALRLGANRVELCSDLCVGGVSPSEESIREAKRVCTLYNAPLMVMVRPRGGNFEYTSDEVDFMVSYVRMAANLGADGIVFGALTKHGWIDEAAVHELLAASVGLRRTFHMAFDYILSSEQLHAIDWLVEAGFDSILTHGSRNAGPIEANFDRLDQYVQHAGNRIEIMPGGGVCSDNIPAVVSRLNVREVHGTKIVEM